jgi:hypothetical protein
MFVTLARKVAVHNDRDLVDAILLYLKDFQGWISSRGIEFSVRYQFQTVSATYPVSLSYLAVPFQL